jgi:hypothetical protein
VILRLYESKQDIINGFDIDCCCVGWDGKDALIVPRCVTALSNKVNMVNLNIRGESYECRLLKYAERGFSIGVPSLESARLDRDHLSFQLEKSPWFDGYEISSDGWKKWGESNGLERLLMAHNLARVKGGITGSTRTHGLPSERRLFV